VTVSVVVMVVFAVEGRAATALDTETDLAVLEFTLDAREMERFSEELI
jgi:hypothetical protein